MTVSENTKKNPKTRNHRRGKFSPTLFINFLPLCAGSHVQAGNFMAGHRALTPLFFQVPSPLRTVQCVAGVERKGPCQPDSSVSRLHGSHVPPPRALWSRISQRMLVRETRSWGLSRWPPRNNKTVMSKPPEVGLAVDFQTMPFPFHPRRDRASEIVHREPGGLGRVGLRGPGILGFFTL